MWRNDGQKYSFEQPQALTQLRLGLNMAGDNLCHCAWNKCWTWKSVCLKFPSKWRGAFYHTSLSNQVKFSWLLGKEMQVLAQVQCVRLPHANCLHSSQGSLEGGYSQWLSAMLTTSPRQIPYASTTGIPNPVSPAAISMRQLKTLVYPLQDQSYYYMYMISFRY